MSRSCSKCGLAFESNWSFCPHCGGAGTQEEPKPRVHEPAPARFAFSGVVLGFVTAPVLIIYGIMICLLGPPMVLGIPLIVLGVLAPFVGPYLAINAVRGKCPWCGAKIASVGPITAFYCHACSKPIVVRDRELKRVE
jgi:predicted amidophosphoribosyltransferase